MRRYFAFFGLWECRARPARADAPEELGWNRGLKNVALAWAEIAQEMPWAPLRRRRNGALKRAGCWAGSSVVGLGGLSEGPRSLREEALKAEKNGG